MTSSPGTILNVNDFAPSRYAKTRLLQDAGYRILEAATGEEALELACREHPDLILLDVNLPDIDGFEVCRRIRNDPTTASIAVLHISAAYVQYSYRVKGLDEGADGYLIEPVEKDELIATIRALLRMRTAEAQVRVASAEWSAGFNAINDGIAIVDRSGRISRCNEALEKFIGNGEVCGGSTVGEVFSRAGVSFRYPDPEDIVRNGRITEEVKIGHRWFSVTIDPVQHDGSSPSSVFVLRDIDDEKIAQQQRAILLESEKRARAFAEASRRQSDFLAEASRTITSQLLDDELLRRVATVAAATIGEWCFIDLIDHKGEPQLVAAANRYGHSLDEPRRLHAAVLASGSFGEPAIRVLRGGDAEMHPDPRVDPADAPAIRSHGTDLAALGASSMICAPICARGRVFGAVTIADSKSSYGESDLHMIQDFAQRIAYALDNARLFRDAQQANRAKDEFLATLSHELRTPLTAALGWTKILKMGDLDSETFHAALETIERSTEVQSQIIEDILDVSRIVSGKLSVDIKSVALEPILDAAVESVRSLASKKRITIALDIPDDLPPAAGDPNRLQQVAWNLLSNAIKFSDEGAEPIEVKVRPVDRWLQLEVRDHGSGIPIEFLPHVFDRFRQADGASTREHGGLGLGLAIVRHLVEMQGGTVEARSEGKGRGAEFIVRIPSYRERESNEVSRSPGELLPLLEGTRVLVVEEDPDARQLLAKILENTQADVRQTGGAKDALDIVRMWKPHVILSGLVPPDEDGISFIERIRASDDTAEREVPVLALSAYARAGDREKALESGFTSYLQKPVDPVALATEIARLTGRDA